jgi:expansin (peptidoglycan-binding protein)
VRRTRSAFFGIAALAVAAGAAVVVHSTTAGAAPSPAGSVSRAAADQPGAEQTGKATFYGSAGSGGNCSFPTEPADLLTTAAGPDLYAQAAGCGGYLDVTGARGTIRVKIDNKCPECEPGHLDLSTEAFRRLDDVSKGIIPITFRKVTDPPLDKALSFKVKEGSSQWWFALLVDNHGNPLKSVEVSTDGSSWKSLTRSDYNYWIADSGAGQGPFKVRVTDVRGHVAVASDIAIRPGEVQQTSTRLYGDGGGSQGSSPAPTAGPTTSKTAPSTQATVPSAPTAQTSARGSARPPTDPWSSRSKPRTWGHHAPWKPASKGTATSWSHRGS